MDFTNQLSPNHNTHPASPASNPGSRRESNLFSVSVSYQKGVLFVSKSLFALIPAAGE